ncbi:hypothetical protein CSUI_011578, partial [Cystoisospora suis]
QVAAGLGGEFPGESGGTRERGEGDGRGDGQGGRGKRGGEGGTGTRGEEEEEDKEFDKHDEEDTIGTEGGEKEVDPPGPGLPARVADVASSDGVAAASNAASEKPSGGAEHRDPGNEQTAEGTAGVTAAREGAATRKSVAVGGVRRKQQDGELSVEDFNYLERAEREAVNLLVSVKSFKGEVRGVADRVLELVRELERLAASRVPELAGAVAELLQNMEPFRRQAERARLAAGAVKESEVQLKKALKSVYKYGLAISDQTNSEAAEQTFWRAVKASGYTQSEGDEAAPP